MHIRPAWRYPLPFLDGRALRSAGSRLVSSNPDGDLTRVDETGEPRTADGHHPECHRPGRSETEVRDCQAGRDHLPCGNAKTRTSLGLGFERDGKPAPAKLEVIGPGETFAVTSPAKPDHEGRIKRNAGTRRLTAEFDGDRLHLFLDELVLWAQSSGPGELKGIRFVAGGAGMESATVDDVAVSRSERSAEPEPWSNLTAGAVRSPDGDETIGSLAAAGPTGVSLDVKGRRLASVAGRIREFTFAAVQFPSGRQVEST